LTLNLSGLENSGPNINILDTLRKIGGTIMNKTLQILIVGSIFGLLYGTGQMIVLRDIHKALLSTFISTPLFVVFYSVIIKSKVGSKKD